MGLASLPPVDFHFRGVAENRRDKEAGQRGDGDISGPLAVWTHKSELVGQRRRLGDVQCAVHRILHLVADLVAISLSRLGSGIVCPADNFADRAGGGILGIDPETRIEFTRSREREGTGDSRGLGRHALHRPVQREPADSRIVWHAGSTSGPSRIVWREPARRAAGSARPTRTARSHAVWTAARSTSRRLSGFPLRGSILRLL